jgi:hypothetical protein
MCPGAAFPHSGKAQWNRAVILYDTHAPQLHNTQFAHIRANSSIWSKAQAPVKIHGANCAGEVAATQKLPREFATYPGSAGLCSHPQGALLRSAFPLCVLRQ